MQPLKQTALALLAIVFIISCQPDPAPDGPKFFTARAYDSKTLQAELSHLSSIDVTKLTEIEREAVAVRQQELEIAQSALNTETNILINIGRCEPIIRVPPGPCPLMEDLTQTVPAGTNIELDLIGVYMDIPDNTQLRVAQDLGSAQVTTLDGKKIFAQGTLNAHDGLFNTAWYQFDMKNPALASKQLLVKIQTVIIVNQQLQIITMQRVIPPGFFKAK